MVRRLVRKESLMEELLIKTKFDVLRTITQIEENSNHTDLTQGERMQWCEIKCEIMRKSILANKSYAQPWKTTFDSIGYHMLKILKHSSFNKDEYGDFMVRKHKAYGAEPILMWGDLIILIRVTSKISRIKNMEGGAWPTRFDLSGSVNSESVQDNIQDILGYCILGLLISK